MKEINFYKDELSEHFYKETDDLILHVFICKETRKEEVFNDYLLISYSHNQNERCINNIIELPTDKHLTLISEEEFNDVVKQVIFDLELYNYCNKL